MTHSKDQDPYANPRAFYGAELRRLREDAGLTQAQLGMRALVVQVLPFAGMREAFMDSMVSIMTFHDSPPVVYTEGGGSGRLIEEPALVERNQRAYDLARAAAMSPAATQALLASMAEDDKNP